MTKNLMMELRSRGYECTMTGLQTSFTKEWINEFECFSLNVKDIGEDVQYLTTLMNVKPDIVFNLFGSDTGNMDRLLEIPLQLGIKNRIWYVPVDGKGLGYNSIYSLKRFTETGGTVVAQCKWGYNQMVENGIKVNGNIYHGYNEKIFKKLDNKIDNKYCWYMTDIGKIEGNPEEISKHFELSDESLCPVEKVGIMKYDILEGLSSYHFYPINEIQTLVKGKYVFGFVGANFGVRKRIERLLNSYTMYINSSKRLKDRTVLWLHTQPISNVGIDLYSYVKKLKIENNVIFSYGSEKASEWSEEAMCRLYNIFDCNVSASSGEGFGLPILESMACGVPQIGTNISSFPELLGDSEEGRGLLVKCELQMIQDGCVRGLIDEDKLYEAMVKMQAYWDKNYDLDKIDIKCIKFAENYTWKKITDEWINLFNNLK